MRLSELIGRSKRRAIRLSAHLTGDGPNAFGFSGQISCAALTSQELASYSISDQSPALLRACRQSSKTKRGGGAASVGGLSHLSMRSYVAHWHTASFRCAAEFGRYRGMADSSEPSCPADLWGRAPQAALRSPARNVSTLVISAVACWPSSPDATSTLPASARDWSAAWLAPATLAETSPVSAETC